MTTDIAIVFAILGVSLVLFITEKLRMDVVAMLVLAALAISGIVGPNAALAGFSNPAVITVWAVFMLSGGLSRTGIANLLGNYMLRLAGTGQLRMIVTIMLTAAVLSAFMNNIGVAALLLPVVMDLSRRTGHAPSRLLMPLAYGSLLGGLTTLIGTPPNLLVSQALNEAGLEPFSLFDFTPVGGAVMIGGILFVALIGPRILPEKDPGRGDRGGGLQLREQYAEERMFQLRPAPGSDLVGKTLEQSRIGAALGLNVIGILRDGRTKLAPDPDTVIVDGDRLLVQGRMDRLETLRRWRDVVIEGRDPELEARVREAVGWAEVRLARDSGFDGLTPFEARLQRRFGVTVAAIARRDESIRSAVQSVPMHEGDRLLLQGRPQALEEARDFEGFADFRRLTQETTPEDLRLDERVFVARVPEGSSLDGRTPGESRIGETFGLRVLAWQRGDHLEALPDPDTPLAVGDRLMFAGERLDIVVLRGLQQLDTEDERPIDPASLESDEVGLVEVMLSPRTRLAGQTLRQLDFRERYGLRVLEVLRGGEAIRTDLASLELRLGDALLLLGDRRKLALLGQESDFLVLSESLQPAKKTHLAPVSITIMVGVMLPVLLGWLPISIAAVSGATLMVVTGCLSMEDAYRSVDWRAIFLISGMLPLGVAMQETGAANLVADGILGLLGPFGGWGAIVGLYLVTALATMIIPTAALVVLMSPIVLKTCADLGISPHAAMMAIAMAASASFTSPISHPANVLVMGPGGYRFKDYVRIGVPLTIVIFFIVMLTLPSFWPLRV